MRLKTDVAASERVSCAVDSAAAPSVFEGHGGVLALEQNTAKMCGIYGIYTYSAPKDSDVVAPQVGPVVQQECARMCGIFGLYAYRAPRTRRAALNTLLNGLRQLEYRG